MIVSSTTLLPLQEMPVVVEDGCMDHGYVLRESFLVIRRTLRSLTPPPSRSLSFSHTSHTQAPNPPTGPQTVVQKTKMVRNACHVRKDTVRLVPPNFQPSGQEEYSSSSSSCGGGRFHLSFRFDATVPCNVAVFWVATEGKDEAGGLW